MELSRLLSEQKRLLRPKAKELKSAKTMILEINSRLKRAGLDAECVAGGSYAKGTRLKDSFDIDLFVRFDKSYNGKDISALLGSALKGLDAETLHGSRDYYQVSKDGLLFEIIPVLKVSSHFEAANVTDMSPLHVEYALSKFKRGMQDEVRLAKQFCKSIGVYGAESHIRGFSGHVVDLLIIHYGSFEQLVAQASIWGERVVIDLEGHHPDPLRVLNKAKLESPMVLVDPLQPGRNAAAALSSEKFERFKAKSRQFITSPSAEYFKVSGLSLEELKRRAGREELIALKACPVDAKKDVAGAKMLKAHEHISKSIEEHGFTLLESGWEFSQSSTLYYIIKKEKLPQTVTAQGPPLSRREDAERFRKRHSSVFEKESRLYAVEKREHTSASSLIDQLIKDKYVTSRVKWIRKA